MIDAAAVVLAAGSSSRLGRPKQLVDWAGRPLLERVLEAVAGWPVSTRVVVLGADLEAILDAVEFGDEIVADNEEWEEGIASSLRVGLDVLTRIRGPEWAFIVLADQPRIPARVPQMLLDVADTTTRPVVLPVYRFQRGNPALVARSLWPRLMGLEGDHGASGLFEAHPEWVEEVRVDAAIPRDVDTELDLSDLLGGPPPASPSGGDGR